jgi:hypothetical protein
VRDLADRLVRVTAADALGRKPATGRLVERHSPGLAEVADFQKKLYVPSPSGAV